MDHRRRSDRRAAGSVLVVALILLIAVAGLAFLSLSTSTSAVKHSANEVTQIRLRATATSAADLVMQQVWNGFVASGNGKVGGLLAFRAYLDSTANPVGAAVAVAKPGVSPVDARAALTLPTSGVGHVPRFAGTAIAQLTVRRTDFADRTDLEITATAETRSVAGAPRQSIRQIVSVAAEPFHGFEYALLSNNVNCIMCHTAIDNAERWFNTDPAKYGTFDRVRVGTLESLLVRTPKSAGGLPLPYSNLAGSLYVRGKVMDNAGGLLKDLTGSTVTGDLFDATGLLQQDSGGSLTPTELTLASGTPPAPYGHMYTDYPIDPALQVDGQLPDFFPPPIPDENGNRKVDGTEFADAAVNATGKISSGVLYEVAHGSSYSGGLPSSPNSSQISGATTNHLMAFGTAQNPLEIDGTVAIDGDLVIQGVIKGNGTIIASGNIYVLGDLVYADGTDAAGSRTFGTAADGTTNGLALAAGGNVIVGDYIDDKNGNMVAGDGTGAFNFTMSEITIFNRGEWSRTQLQLPDQNGVLVDNPLYVPNYKPRYYVMGNGDPVFVYNKLGSGKTPAIWFDAATQTWKGKEHPSSYDSTISTYKPGDPVYDNATILPLGTNTDWLSEGTLKNLWGEVDKDHSSGPMEVDGLIYSNNSAWTLVRDSSVYRGKLTLNGSLVAADTGILVIQRNGVGLQLNYDKRQVDKLKLRQSDDPVTITRALWVPAAN